jgi:hypothetical protein
MHEGHLAEAVARCEIGYDPRCALVILDDFHGAFSDDVDGIGVVALLENDVPGSAAQFLEELRDALEDALVENTKYRALLEKLDKFFLRFGK